MAKWWLKTISVGYLLWIVYQSLIPFDFSLDSGPTPTVEFDGFGSGGVSMPDAISNIAVYVPLGCLVLALFVRGFKSRWAGIAGTVLAAAALSAGLELAQSLEVSRVASIVDFLCNMLGTLVGMMLYVPLSAVLTRLAHRMRSSGVAHTERAATGACIVVILVTSLIPFDLTFDVSHLASAIRRAELIPFAGHSSLMGQVGAAETATPAYHMALRSLWDLRLDYVADAGLFLVLGVLLARQLRRGYWGYLGAVAVTAGTIAWLAALITVAGLFVMSVGLDATRILTRSGGGLIGAICHPLLIGAVPPAAATIDHRRWHHRRVLAAGMLLCAGYIAARQLSPFQFDRALGWNDQAAIEWLPFQAYAATKLPTALVDIFHKSLRFVALGALWGVWGMVGHSRGHRARSAVGVGLVASGVGVLEFLQCWLPGRVPSVTDVLLAVGATAAGVALGQALHEWWQQTASKGLGAATSSPAPLWNVELGPPRDQGPDPVPRERRRQPPTRTRIGHR